MKVLLTGASGFVGQQIHQNLQERTHKVRTTRRAGDSTSPLADETAGGIDFSLYDRERWLASVAGCQAVIHCAGIAHVQPKANHALGDLTSKVNVEATIRLAELAVETGAKRFVFLSSIKVNGEETSPGQAFSETDIPMPLDVYGRSKLEAENGLRALAGRTGLEVTIIRPPLVYGPGAKGNLASIQRWLARDLPLPLGAIDNRRTLMGIGNLADLVCTAMEQPQAANQIFLAGDGVDLSTTDLIKMLAKAMGSRSAMLPVPVSLLEVAAGIFGRSEQVKKLSRSLRVDTSKAQNVLGWKPALPTELGLIAMAAAYRKQRDSKIEA